MSTSLNPEDIWEPYVFGALRYCPECGSKKRRVLLTEYIPRGRKQRWGIFTQCYNSGCGMVRLSTVNKKSGG